MPSCFDAAGWASERTSGV